MRIHKSTNPSTNQPINKSTMAKRCKLKKQLVQYCKLLFFGSWCVMFGFMMHDISTREPPTPKPHPTASDHHQRPITHRPKEPTIPLLRRKLPSDIPIKDIEEDDLLVYLKPVRNEPGPGKNKTAAKYPKRNHEIRAQDKQRVRNRVESALQVDPHAVPDAPTRQRSGKHGCQINYVISKLNEGWFHPKEHVDLLRGCEAVIYNRVPKCGSRSVLETFKYLAKANNFTVYDRATPYGGKRSHYDLKSDLVSERLPFV